MYKEYKSMLIITLCMLTLVSVGFSSWIVTTPSATIDTEGYLEADSIIDNRNYIINTESTEFEYTQLGFLKDGVFTNVGELTVSYNIKLANCKEYFESLGEECVSLTLEVKNKYSDNISATYNVFDDNVISVSYNDGNGYSNQQLSSINYVNHNMSKIILDDLTNNNYQITFKYSFAINPGSTFKNSIYEGLLKGNENKEIFEFSAKLTNNVVSQGE